MYILGLNAFHGDAAACLMKDGELVAAVEEERLTRIKHQAGFPAEAIKDCLAQQGIGIGDVDHVAINRDPKAALWRKAAYTLTRRPSLSLLTARLRNARSWAGLDESLSQAFPDEKIRAQVHHIEHHAAHLASAFDPSPFDRALALSVDGFGDFASAAWGLADNNSIDIAGRVHFPHSLGVFYQAMTQYLGFPNYGDEYKLMGLSAYGEANHVDAVGRLVKPAKDGSFKLDLRYFRHGRENVPYEWSGGAPKAGILFTDELEVLLGPRRSRDEELSQYHRDLAASVQAVYEQALFRLINSLVERFGEKRLVLAGGCGQNSLANGRIIDNTPVEALYVPPSAADGGGAVGAAMQLWRQLSGARCQTRIHDGGLGGSFDHHQIQTAVNERRTEIEDAACRIAQVTDEDQLCEQVARQIADGAVVGWFQGKMEWGPRALGHRSILADPRRDDMRAHLNAKIKLRESFRPFAPSALADKAPEWFETGRLDALATAFMACVRPVRQERQSEIPAVTHVDGTARLQSVSEQDSPAYYRLIKAFETQTGVPMLLNTSFNENEPIVHTPAQALDCFLRTRMDVLVMGDLVITREPS